MKDNLSMTSFKYEKFNVNGRQLKSTSFYLDEITKSYKNLKLTKSTIVPGCNHCIMSRKRSIKLCKTKEIKRNIPIFLEKLESFIDQELSKIEIEPCSSNCMCLTHEQEYLDAQLKVYRSAFHVILSKITTFKSILIQIKHVYDKSLQVRNNRLTLMEHVSNNLENYKKNVEERLERIKKESVTEINNLKKKNLELTNKINELEAESTAKDKTITLLKDEMLMVQKDVFSQQQQKSEINEKSVENKGETVSAGSEENEDPVLLRVCLNRTRKDLSTAHRKITELEETYRDVVPKRELEKLDNLHQVSKREQEALIDEIKSLNREYALLKSALETVKEQKNSLRDRCKTLAHTNTPRPDWSKCGQFIQGGVQRWRDITAKKSSEERLTILLSELCGAASAENDFFIGQGTDQSVPVFLRYKGKVKNRKLGRREVSILINDIWKNKVVADLNTPMGEYILKYFAERYHLPAMRYEWIYNLYNACQRLMYDAQIGLFWGVLWGEVAEDVYHVARKDFAVLRKMMEMRMEDKKINALLAEDIMEIVARMYPYKKNEDIENFVYAAAKQLGIDPSTEAFDIAKLFAPNEEGWERGDFGREFAKQMVQEITEFGKSILNKIDVQDKNTMIRMEVLKRGFLTEDEGIPQALLAQHLKWIYKTADLSKTKPISANVVIQRMISGYIRRCHLKRDDKTES